MKILWYQFHSVIFCIERKVKALKDNAVCSQSANPHTAKLKSTVLGQIMLDPYQHQNNRENKQIPYLELILVFCLCLVNKRASWLMTFPYPKLAQCRVLFHTLQAESKLNDSVNASPFKVECRLYGNPVVRDGW